MGKITEKDNSPVLEVVDLCKYFKMGRHTVQKAVDKVSFSIRKGETLGLVGESGCGKTTCGRTSIGLYEKNSGKTLFYGKEITDLKGRERKEFAKRAQVIFQDPYKSLDPRMRVEQIVAEGIRIHKLADNKAAEEERIKELLNQVGLHKDLRHRFVSEFSGGQRQRIGIARALAAEPEFLLCDEPISALDVSIQAQIMNLLMNLQETMGLTYLFIAHNLAAVKYISTKTAVMYLGQIVEIGNTEEMYAHPLHPYTQALMAAVPIPDPDMERERKRVLLGEVKKEIVTGTGCKFAPRCPHAAKRCFEEVPQLMDMGGEHQAACHRVS